MKLVLPTKEQIEWADCEIGVIIHLDLVTFAEKDYNFREHWNEPLSADLFNPQYLDTDQWIEAAAKMGAKYAVLVAKHCTGFCLWPTEAYDYSVATSPWKNGKGDIVRDFIVSCKKYEVKPGLYYSSFCNHYLKVDNGRVLSNDKDEQEKYNSIVIKQLTELWSNYGKLFEIWFDGGCLPVEEGGPDITSLLHKLQPDANVFQGPEGTKSLLRWVGNEKAHAPENCSSIFNFEIMRETGTIENNGCGDTNGDTWCPAESDRPNREAPSFQGGWFWQEDEEKYIVPPQELYEMYINSVGRNTNMLIGMGIDKNGLFPKEDIEQFNQFSELIKENFSNELSCAEIKPYCTSYLLKVPENKKSKYVVLQEDISFGERVEEFIVFADTKEYYKGKIIGHKRIIPVSASEIEIKITKYKAPPKLKTIKIY